MKWLGDNLYWLIPSLIAAGAAYFAWSSAQSATASEESAERAAGAAEKSAKADVEMAALARMKHDAELADRTERPWNVEPLGNDRWRATNRGPAVFTVGVEGYQGLSIEFGEHEDAREVVGTGESFTMIITRTGPGGMLTFRWAIAQYGAVAQVQQVTI